MNLLRMNALLLANRQSTTPFSMHNWTWGLPGVLRGVDCATPACLIGNYAARQDLQSEFRLLKNGGGVQTRDRKRCIGPALEMHFDLTTEEVKELFDMDGCDEAREDRAKAIAYVESFIARKLTERPAPEPEEGDEEDEEIAAAA